MKKKVVFVCTGNVCRSPMAEFFLKEKLGASAEWHVSSCGIYAGEGQPASSASSRVMQEKGIDLSTHASHLISPDLVDSSSVILVMTRGHRDQIRALHPEAMQKVFLLRSFDPLADTPDIEDPLGFSDSFYRQTRDQIEASMPGLIEFLRRLKVDEKGSGRKTK